MSFNQYSMRIMNKILNYAFVGILSLMWSSCSEMLTNPDASWDGDLEECIATIMPVGNTDSCLFECNGDYFFATNYQTTRYDTRVRALIEFQRQSHTPVIHFGQECIEILIYRIKIIDTSEVLPEDDKPLGPESPLPGDDLEGPNNPPTTDTPPDDTDQIYGCDPISFYHPGNYSNVCYTHIADGFLHLHVVIPVGDEGCEHHIKIIPYVPKGSSEALPLHFDLRHKQIGSYSEYDPETSIVGETVVAFDISYLNLDSDNDYIVIHTDNAMGKQEAKIYNNTQPIL